MTAPHDMLHDFCLWPYEPLTDPAGKLPFSTLLRASFALASQPGRLVSLLERLQGELGAQATVWGVKWNGQAPSWELYFYDYARTDRLLSIERVRDILGLYWSDAPDVAHIPYFMFSLEVDADGRITPGADVYVGSPGSEVSAGLCYACSGDSASFKNFYHFFEASREFDQVLAKLSNSIHLPFPRPNLDELLWPRTRHCQTLVIANKRSADGVYYSRVSVAELIWFLARMEFPATLQEWLRAESAAYSHMLFDLGVDFRAHNHGIEFFRGAFYGVA